MAAVGDRSDGAAVTVLQGISMGLLAFAGVLGLLRVLRPGSLVDRSLGLDFFVTTVAIGIVVGAVVSRTTVYVPIVVVVTLLAFVATVSVARFIERRGA